MIQIREQYGVIYLRIISDNEMFLHTYRTITAIPGVTYKVNTGEFMVDPMHLEDLLKLYKTHIVWMTPFRDIVEKFDVPLTQAVNELLQLSSDKDFDSFKLKPYPYQRIGARFLALRKTGAVLDGVGLGKTIQTIAAAHLLELEYRANGHTKPHLTLVVTLNSIKRQWAREIEKFTPYTALAATGDFKKRRTIMQEFPKSGASFLIINYEMLRDEKYINIITNIGFQVVILDEAQRIKSGVDDKMYNIKPSQVAQGAYKLMGIPNRFIATATPMQGALEEIFSLFKFIDPRILGDWNSFRERFCDVHRKYGIMGYKEEHVVSSWIMPWFIRRTKEMPEIQQQLPRVSFESVRLEMTKEQCDLTDYIRNEIATLKEESKKINGPKMFGTDLLTAEEAQERFDQMIQGYQSFLASITDSPYLLQMSDSKLAQKIMAESGIYPKKKDSPKLDYLEDLVKTVLSESSSAKFIVFSRFERMVQLIQERFGSIAVSYTGEMNEKQKDQSVDRFWNDPSCRVFCGTEAASTGLNLQCARYLVHMDLNYDPTIMEQRNGRIDRTGNPNKNISILYLIHQDSYDEDILKNHAKKNALRSTVLTGGRDDFNII